MLTFFNKKKKTSSSGKELNKKLIESGKTNLNILLKYRNRIINRF